MEAPPKKPAAFPEQAPPKEKARWIHPLQSPTVTKVVHDLAPEYTEALKSCQLPTERADPGALEAWETEKIKERIGTKNAWETDFVYTMRILYEETFGVNHAWGKSFMGSNAATLGGLVSHNQIPYKINERSGESKQYILSATSLRDYLRTEPNSELRNTVTELVHSMTYPVTLGKNYVERPFTNKISELAQNPERTYPPEMDSDGFRLLKILTTYPEILTDVAVPNWLHTLTENRIRATHLDPATLLRSAWRSIGEKVLHQGDHYNADPNNPNVQEGFKALVGLRTDKDMSIFFHHLSPSAYLPKTE